MIIKGKEFSVSVDVQPSEILGLTHNVEVIKKFLRHDDNKLNAIKKVLEGTSNEGNEKSFEAEPVVTIKYYIRQKDKK